LNMSGNKLMALANNLLLSDVFYSISARESKVPAKYRELMGLAVAANIKCPYCQLFHKSVAQMYGATEEELAEIAFLASYTSRWSSMIARALTPNTTIMTPSLKKQHK